MTFDGSGSTRSGSTSRSGMINAGSGSSTGTAHPSARNRVPSVFPISYRWPTSNLSMRSPSIYLSPLGFWTILICMALRTAIEHITLSRRLCGPGVVDRPRISSVVGRFRRGDSAKHKRPCLLALFCFGQSRWRECRSHIRHFRVSRRTKESNWSSRAWRIGSSLSTANGDSPIFNKHAIGRSISSSTRNCTWSGSSRVARAMSWTPRSTASWEALNNVAGHARARNATVEVQREFDYVSHRRRWRRRVRHEPRHFRPLESLIHRRDGAHLFAVQTWPHDAHRYSSWAPVVASSVRWPSSSRQRGHSLGSWTVSRFPGLTVSVRRSGRKESQLADSPAKTRRLWSRCRWIFTGRWKAKTVIAERVTKWHAAR